MTHQIRSHLAFCTPRQNKKAKQGTNPEILKRNKQTHKKITYFSMNLKESKEWVASVIP